MDHLDGLSRRRLAAARVARLATVRPDGSPHLVPIVFALVDETIWTAVDNKPKTTRRPARLANVTTHPRVCVLVDHYDEDWRTLWWIRADGSATVTTDPREIGPGRAALVAKYPQYLGESPPGPWIRIEVDHWRAWSADAGNRRHV